MSDSLLREIEVDVAETERLMTELRLQIAVRQSAGEDTIESERRLQDMLKGWMLLQDQKATEANRGAAVVEQTMPDFYARRSSSISKWSS